MAFFQVEPALPQAEPFILFFIFHIFLSLYLTSVPVSNIAMKSEQENWYSNNHGGTVEKLQD